MGAGGCSDPCCNGNADGIDCAKNPVLTCTETGDPCTARQYGCAAGAYFVKAPATSAACAMPDAGLTADDGGGSFEGDDGDLGDAALDAGSDEATDAGSDGTADGDGAPPLDASIDSPDGA